MNLFNLFVPETIKFPDSKFNKNISVSRFINATTLFVDGLIESGEVMTRVWRKGIKSLLPKSFSPKKVLLLGLAGGCNAHLINRFYPKASITAVEIDPFMVTLGNKYFNLKKVKNLKIIIADALDFANNLGKTDQYDLVLVDCFVGQEIPQKLEDPQFLDKLKKHSRFVLINRLWYQKEKAITSNFFRKISPYFFFVKTHTISNVVISLV